MCDLDPHHLIHGWMDDLDPPQWASRKGAMNCHGCECAITTTTTHSLNPASAETSKHCRLCGQLFCSSCCVHRHLPIRFEKKGYRMESNPTHTDSVGFTYPSPVCKGCDTRAQQRKRALVYEVAALEGKYERDFMDVIVKDVNTNAALQLFPCWEKALPARSIVDEFHHSYPDLGPVAWLFHGQDVAEDRFRDIPLAEIGDVVYVRCAARAQGAAEDELQLGWEERIANSLAGAIGAGEAGAGARAEYLSVSREWWEDVDQTPRGAVAEEEAAVPVNTYACASSSAERRDIPTDSARKVSVAAGGVVVEEEDTGRTGHLQWFGGSSQPSRDVPGADSDTEDPATVSFRRNTTPGIPEFGGNPGDAYSHHPLPRSQDALVSAPPSATYDQPRAHVDTPSAGTASPAAHITTPTSMMPVGAGNAVPSAEADTGKSAVMASAANTSATATAGAGPTGAAYVRAKYDYTSAKAGKYLSFRKHALFRVSKDGEVWLWVAPLLPEGGEGKKGWVPRKYVVPAPAPTSSSAPE